MDVVITLGIIIYRIDGIRSIFQEGLNYYLDSKNILKLECHIEYMLFKSLLAGKFPWNTSLTGSTIMYKRSPNKFNIDMIFSLNFLRV